ncbi:hypothetical protein O181_010570 [Austropuccinia psidii MF-1]|uniref:Retrotransposon gag domain-containing protein n=1 Tax=Austropuccinia psidii MF-1 TaxID=1389203 RepID=A0A9Q3BTG7_9BASI|nr:hypothetical protein [Austropuccinia psidii MF-1]
MPIQHSPPARQTISRARAQAVLTPTPRAPLDSTPEVPQMRAQLDRGTHLEGEEPSIQEGRGPRRSNFFQEQLVVFQDFQGPLSKVLCNKPVSHHSEPSLLSIMQQMIQIMATLQEASSSEESKPPAFKTPSMKAPKCFEGTQPFKVRSFIQPFQFIFNNDPENFSQDIKKVLYSTSFLIDRASKWIEPYLSNLANQEPSYLLNSWTLFESKLFTLFGDPNEVKKAEAELDSLRIKEGG